MTTALANPQVVVNNQAVSIVPNSVTFTEGLGEQTVRAASSGGGAVQQVFSNNIETNFASIKFEVYPGPATIDLIRSWKSNKNQNVVSLSGTATDGIVSETLRRTFANASITNNYDVALGADTTIEVEFMSDQAS